MLLCTFCFSPSRINFSTVCMPNMHTHSYELWGEGEGTAWTCTDKITKILHQGWELNLLPLPSDFTTRPSLLLPTGTVAQHYRQISGVSRLGERHLAVLKPFGRSAGTGVFCFTLWCSKEGKKTPPFPTEQLTLPSLLIQSALLLLPGISLFQGCTCHLLRNKREQGGAVSKAASHAEDGKHRLPSLWEHSEMKVPQECHMAVLLV